MIFLSNPRWIAKILMNEIAFRKVIIKKIQCLARTDAIAKNWRSSWTYGSHMQLINRPSFNRKKKCFAHTLNMLRCLWSVHGEITHMFRIKCNCSSFLQIFYLNDEEKHFNGDEVDRIYDFFSTLRSDLTLHLRTLRVRFCFEEKVNFFYR